MNNRIVSVKHLNNHKLEIHFSDDVKQVVDFEPFLRNSKNPMTRKFIEMNHFQNYKIENGDLLWGDYEMCFPVWDLYEGRI